MDNYTVFILLIIVLYLVSVAFIKLRNYYLKITEEKKQAERREQFLEENREQAEERIRELEEQQKKKAIIRQQIKEKQEAERLERLKVKKEAEQQREHEYKQVALYSLRYRRLLVLFDSYGVLENFRTDYSLSYVYHSRRVFDEAERLKAFRYLANEKKEIRDSYEKVKQNRQAFEQFTSEVCVPKQSPQSVVIQSGLPSNRFYEIEEELCKKLENKLIMDMNVELYLYYRAGGEHALKTFSLNYDDLTQAYKIEQLPDIEYTSTQEEREKMTPSLRYSILQRDGFRCTICGASANDGAKLHVDHIRPVSKGGKTEPANLRTLCDRCNLGKGAKYDPSGIN